MPGRMDARGTTLPSAKSAVDEQNKQPPTSPPATACTLHNLQHFSLRSKVKPGYGDGDAHGNGRRTLPLPSYPAQGPAKFRREKWTSVH
ncbi:hypothetical protein CSHISOI_05622 [Colletotrichum shisoi]|uniref:Uncharacterized protein n=1 Tax=Colletotrichum shisoi TaxID=2078593 RepID=A0A5Q4BSU8_9PEZI|nr:hypothetical protein CSHISOI_05622 [Colletotrichum shisoi]